MRTVLMFPQINTNKQCYLGSGHTILMWSIRKNVLFQMYFLDNVKKNVLCGTKFCLMLYKTILDILTKRKQKSTMTGFEPGPTARKPSMITARPGDMF